MTPQDAAASARRNLRLLAGELRVDLHGLEDSDLELVAIRFVLDGRVTTDALQAIVDDVRDGSGQATVGTNTSGSLGIGQPAQEPALPPAPKRGYRFNATEADRRQRHKLALQHLSESRRTGLYLVPRKPEVLPVDVPHPACLVSAREEHGTVCKRCAWLLRDDPYTDAWLDRDDSTGGRL